MVAVFASWPNRRSSRRHFASHLTCETCDPIGASSSRSQAPSVQTAPRTVKAYRGWLRRFFAFHPGKHPEDMGEDEATAFLSDPALMARVLYGGGLRLLECCHLRLKDLDLETSTLMLRDTKRNKDRATVIPQAPKPALREQIHEVRELHQADLAQGAGWVELPQAFARKSPQAARNIAWQWLFPATRTYDHAPTGIR